MARYRTYTIEFKRRVAEEHLGAGTRIGRPLPQFVRDDQSGDRHRK